VQVSVDEQKLIIREVLQSPS